MERAGNSVGRKDKRKAILDSEIESGQCIKIVNLAWLNIVIAFLFRIERVMMERSRVRERLLLVKRTKPDLVVPTPISTTPSLQVDVSKLTHISKACDLIGTMCDMGVVSCSLEFWVVALR